MEILENLWQVGGAEAARHRYGCRIVAHELDAAYLESGDSAVTAANWYGARMNPSYL